MVSFDCSTNDSTNVFASTSSQVPIDHHVVDKEGSGTSAAIQAIKRGTDIGIGVAGGVGAESVGGIQRVDRDMCDGGDGIDNSSMDEGVRDGGVRAMVEAIEGKHRQRQRQGQEQGQSEGIEDREHHGV